MLRKALVERAVAGDAQAVRLGEFMSAQHLFSVKDFVWGAINSSLFKREFGPNADKGLEVRDEELAPVDVGENDVVLALWTLYQWVTTKVYGV